MRDCGEEEVKGPTLSQRTREGWGTRFVTDSLGEVYIGYSPRGAEAPRFHGGGRLSARLKPRPFKAVGSYRSGGSAASAKNGVNTKHKVKGSGQECPLHTGKGNVNIYGS